MFLAESRDSLLPGYNRQVNKMLKEDWRELFQPWLLERGKNYGNNGKVTELEWDEECLSVTVMGTEEYDVELFLDDGEVAEMYCSCPYAKTAIHVSIWRLCCLPRKWEYLKGIPDRITTSGVFPFPMAGNAGKAHGGRNARISDTDCRK